MKKQKALKMVAAIRLDAFQVLCSMPASSEAAEVMTSVCSQLDRLADLIQAEPIRWNQELEWEGEE